MKLVIVLLFLVLSSDFPVVTATTNSPTDKNILIDYFTQLNQITQIGIFTCGQFNDTQNLVKLANHRNLRWFTGVQSKEVLASSRGFYLNLSCPEAVKILTIASEYNLFEKGYKWLLDSNSDQAPHEILEAVSGIRADSQISFTQNIGDVKILYDVYGYGKHLRSDVSAEVYGQWSNVKGFNLSHVPRPSLRKDFDQTELRLMIFTGVEGSSEVNDIAYFDDLYTRFGTTFDHLLQVKYFHSLNLMLREKFNLKATVTFVTHDVEQYDRLNGADMISAGAFLEQDNLEQFDFIFSKFRIEQDLFYLLTPELTSDRDYLTFLIPLDTPVWVVFILFLILLASLVKIFGLISKSNDIDVITQIVGIVTSQGVSPMPENYSLRGIFLTGLMMMLILFNLYTASLIGVILTPMADKFENSTQVLRSDIALARQNDYYTQQALEVR